MADIQQLMDMGFAAADAEAALSQAGNVEQALELLLTGVKSPSPAPSVASPETEWPELPKKPATTTGTGGYNEKSTSPPGLEEGKNYNDLEEKL